MNPPEIDFNRLTRAGACHCLCTANHPSVPGVCTVTRETTVAFFSEITGRVAVAMCEACAQATRGIKETAASEGGGSSA